MRVGIIGGGLMGMALASRYAAEGHEVTIVEYAEQAGGLTTWSDFGGFNWDKFHHVILPSDQQLIGFLRDLGMEDELEWNRTDTGFYVDNKLHSISSKREFLKFPLLSLFAKIKLGSAMRSISSVNSWKPLEQVSCEQWLREISGKENVEKLWKPLLLARFGPAYSRMSAVFIWSYIKRMLSARKKSAGAGNLGHLRGGYESVFRKIIQQIADAGGRVLLEENVLRVSATKDSVSIHTPLRSLKFDEVVCTSPVNVLQKIVDKGLLAVSHGVGNIEYLGVVCVVLVTTQPITRFYKVNVADESIPFTGVIGMSNVVNTKNTRGYHLTYLPKYLLSTDPENGKPDGYYREAFLEGLESMFPDFDQKDIVSMHVHRAVNVQPLQVINYSSMVPSVNTNDPRFHVLNTSQFVNTTPNNNEVIGAVNSYYESIAAGRVS